MNLIKVTDRDARSGRALFLPCRCSNPPLYVRKVLDVVISLLLFLCATHAQATTPIELKSGTTLATAGYFQLIWSWPDAPADINYSLMEITAANKNSNGHEIYDGPDLASVISGKPNGTYRYRVRAIDALHNVVAQSNQIAVVVAHHSLLRAWLIFSLGAFVFVAILVVVQRESAKSR